MYFSVSSLLSFSFLSLLASTSLAAGIPKRTLHTDLTNTETIVKIYQLFNFYSLVLDDKEYDDLSLVFTKDVVFKLPTYSFSTLPVVKESYRAEYLNKITLHTLENVLVYNITATKASVLSDGVVIYFGQGKYTGQTTTFYSRFNDTVVKEAGFWKISARTLVSQVSFVLTSSTTRR